MESIGDRIRTVRRTLGMTQTEFAVRIGSVQNTVTGYENGRRNPSSPVVALICREFGVNQKWLESGVGEMFIEHNDSFLISLAAEYNLNEADITAIKSFLELPPEYRMGVIKWGRNFAEKTAAQLGIDFPAQSDSSRRDDVELTREEIHAMIDRELDETEAASKRGIRLSAFTSSSGLGRKFGNTS